MAIKTSWTAGEVLTAADLTDTFADKVDLTPSATQTITSGTATVKPLVIKAAASQTANLLEFQNSAGTAVRAVLPDGTITGQNLLYNGAMQVAQRGTSTASITASSFNTADRWAVNLTTLGTWTQSVEADAPTGSGLRNSLKMLVTTADASPAAGDIALVCQILEGQDCQRIAKGTASAQQLTLSFWVKANVTGTYVAEVVDEDNSRAVSASYTISASATWEKKTITFPADTTGAITNDNTAGMRVNWWIGAGSTYTSGTLATTWGATTSANRAVGQTNVAAAINNYWQVTGVQLEVGPVASAFEFKPFGQELRECQRYYVRFSNTGGSNAFSVFAIAGMAEGTTTAVLYTPLPTTMRAVPTAVDRGGTMVVVTTLTTQTVTATTMQDRSTNSVASVTYTVASGLTANTVGQVRADNSTSAYLGFSAEL